ncbi:MAG: type II toxin-antitoxin system VapC family toxin [Candidatus Binatia bacterium]
MIVLDASAALELLLNTKAGTEVAARIGDPDLTIGAPHLIDVEVAQVLRRYVRAGQIEADRAALAVR